MFVIEDKYDRLIELHPILFSVKGEKREGEREYSALRTKFEDKTESSRAKKGSESASIPH